MAEMDAFTRRVADTLAWYADEVQPAVNAPVVAHRVALEHPRRRADAPSWRVATPPRGWVLLLAALLAALVGGTLLVGSQLQRKLPAVVPPVGQLFECPPGSTPDKPGPVDQARPLGPTTMAFDRRAGRVVAIAQTATGIETWTFDVCTNTWNRMHPDQEPGDPGWAPGLVYDADSDVTIGIFNEEVWAYDLGADAWTRLGEVPSAGDFGPRLLYDPISGLVVAWNGDARNADGDLWNYDVETDAWTLIRQDRGPSWWVDAITYDASVDRVIAYAPGFGLTGEETWLFDLRTGRWTRSRAATPHLTFPAIMATLRPAIAYDEAAKRTVISGSDGMATYDAAADRWETLYDLPGPDLRGTIPGRPERFPRSLAYDPLNERLVAPGEILMADGSPLWTAPDGTDVGAFDVLAFDTRTREWTVLLEADRRSRSPE